MRVYGKLCLDLIEIYARNIDGVWFGVAYQGQKVFASSFGKTEKAVFSTLLKLLPYNLAFQIVSEPSVFGKQIVLLIKIIYDGKESQTNIPLSYEYSPAYTSQVLKTVIQIPVGYVSSYGFIAKAAGGGPRAVGNVMAANPFAPIVPCHRVVTSDLQIGGYSGGLATKFELLKRERRGYPTQREIKVNDKQIIVFPVEFVFSQLQKKFPSVLSKNP